jgi:catechol 2,3-dioxygenase-like lactoylglutathione lyase family enzyme
VENLMNYPGSAELGEEARHNAGSKPLQRPDPLIKVWDVAYVMFEKPDLEKQLDFLQDFGMVLSERSDNTMYLRGCGPSPWFYRVTRGAHSRFSGAGFEVRSREELETISAATGLGIEAIEEPGGGERVRLTDPDGFLVDIVYGREKLERLACREQLFDVNTPGEKRRVNRRISTEPAPSPLERLGHLVLAVTDFQASSDWYMRHLGVIPTDVQCLSDGSPALAFTRCDRGEVPADHHTVVLVQNIAPSCMHTAYETLDLDSVGQGSQYLHWKGWKHYWGIGRHILGSQIFDYWKDPFGDELEHYADGDMFDASHPTGYHPLEPGSLWSWGEDAPAPPTPPLKAVFKILLGLQKDGPSRSMLGKMRAALSLPARPWSR